MANTKLKSYSPVITDGEHKKFPNKYAKGESDKFMYVFNVEFEDGSKGQANAKSAEPNYKVGQEYEVTATPNGDYPDRISMKLPGSGKGTFGQKAYNSETPEEKAERQRSIIAQSSIKAAVDIKANELDFAGIEQMSDEIYDYVIAKMKDMKPPDEKQLSSMLAYAAKKDEKSRVAILKGLLKYNLSDEMFLNIAKATLE